MACFCLLLLPALVAYAGPESPAASTCKARKGCCTYRPTFVQCLSKKTSPPSPLSMLSLSWTSLTTTHYWMRTSDRERQCPTRITMYVRSFDGTPFADCSKPRSGKSAQEAHRVHPRAPSLPHLYFPPIAPWKPQGQEGELGRRE